jgi:hypothetical protein
MKIFHRSASAIVIAALLTSAVGCTTCRSVPLNSAADAPATAFEPDTKYRVEFESGQSYSVKGDRLTVREGMVGIRLENEPTYRYYQSQQIRRLCREEISAGRTAGVALGGAAVLGGIIAAIIIGGLGAAQE